MIYLDNAATTFPKPESVYVAMDKSNRELAVNAGRGSYKVAREASKLIYDTKNSLRRLINADISTSVVFTPSITIALNEIIKGIEWHAGDVVYASPYEHNAVARTLHLVEQRHGIKIKLLPLDSESLEIDIEKMQYEFSKEKPKAVFCSHVSNVTGYILPIEDIFSQAKKYNAITVLDTAQSLGLVKVDAKSLNADLIAFAGHKTLYGPFGIGGFFNISGVPLKVCIVGGTGSDSLNLEMPDGPETRYESSSSNIVAIAGLNAAILSLNQEESIKKEQELTDYLIEKLSNIKEVTLYLPENLSRHVGIVSFTIDEFSSEDIGTILDADFDIAVRTGYHCAPWIHDYLKDKNSLGTVRIGLGQFNSVDDIEKLVNAINDIL